MTPRAPVVTQCLRQGKKWSFRTRKHVRSNPASDADIADMYPKVRRRFLSEYKTHSKREDIAQEAVEAMLRAAKTYDPSRGIAFSTHAMHQARLAVADFVRRDSGGKARSDARKRLESMLKAYQKAYPGRNQPSTAELAAHAGVDVQELYDLRQRAALGQLVSSSQSAISEDEDDGSTVEDTLASASAAEVEAGQAAQIDIGAQRAKVRELSRLEQMFDAYLQQGKSVSWIARQMKISESKARDVAQSLRAHLAPPAED